MAGLIQAPKGTKDVVPARVHQWQYVEGVLRRTAREFGFTEIRFPVFEYTELFCAASATPPTWCRRKCTL